MTASGLGSRSVAERFDFAFCTSDENEIFLNDAVNTVFVATRHNTHARYVLKSLRAGKHVFVEKPLCLTEAELRSIEEAVAGRSASSLLMVGFNRRFSPLAEFVRSDMGQGPMSMVYRVNAGPLPRDSWIRDAAVGGGRIVAEVCHFIDLLTFFNGSLPIKVQTFGMLATDGLADTVTVNIAFANGSIATIAYFANGAPNVPKEYVEIYRDGKTAILKDFVEAQIVSAKSTPVALVTKVMETTAEVARRPPLSVATAVRERRPGEGSVRTRLNGRVVVAPRRLVPL